MRRNKQLERYGNEFTIRSTRPNAETELVKMLRGWGNYIIYGFAPEGDSGPEMVRWFLGSVFMFRLWFFTELRKTGQMPGIEKSNPDGSSKFRAFDLSQMPGGFVLASSQTHDRLVLA